MRSVLILGCGYVGRALARRRLAAGDRVLAVTRNADMASQLKADGIEVFQGGVQEREWHAWAGNVDWAINCVSSAGGGLQGYRVSYILGNRSFADWMARSGFSGPAVYTSSVSVYPDRKGAWVSESDARPHGDRARIALEAEAAFREGESRGTRTILRLGGIYGPGRSFLVDRIRKGEGMLPGYGDYYLNLIRLEDIVGAIEAVFHRSGGPGGVYSVVDNEPQIKGDLVSGLARVLGIGRIEFDPNRKPLRGPRRNDGQPPANRRVSNRRFRDAFDWAPDFPNALQGMSELVSS